MKKTISILSACMAVILTLLLLASCGQTNKTPTGETAAPTEDQIPASVSAVEADETDATVIAFNGETAAITGAGASADGAHVQIESGGTYTVRGKTSNGQILVNAPDEDVTILLDNAQITCADSSAIYVYSAKQTTVYAKEGTENTLTDGKTYAYNNDFSSEADEEPNACLYAKDDLILTGTGSLTVNGNAANGVTSKDALTVESLTLTVTAANHGVTGKDSLTVKNAAVTVNAQGDALRSTNDSDEGMGCIVISGGTLDLTCEDDGIHAVNQIAIEDGDIQIKAHEGIEGTLVTINGGSISIQASDDGINAAQKIDGVTPTVTINGGELDIEMGQGDTDGVDANGDIIINGGTVRVTGQSAFDYDGKAELNGGEVYVNGEKVTELENQFGGMGGGRTGGFSGGFPGERPEGADGERPSRPDGENGQNGFFPRGDRAEKNDTAA